MTQNSQFSKANIYSEQPRTRNITPKVIFFVALALISTALWIHYLFVPSLTGNWLWICSLFLLGLIIGSSSLAIWNFKKWWPGGHKAPFRSERAGGQPPDRARCGSACAELVDEVKRSLPIWKHQRFTDGTDEWVNCP